MNFSLLSKKMPGQLITISILNSLIQCQKLKHKPLYVCFVDFIKAFNYINRSDLYYKLFKRGVKGKSD